MSDLLVLLHGRGADERDLLPVASLVAPGARVLAPRAPHRVGPGFGWAPEEADVLAGDGLEAAAAEVLASIEAAGADRVLLLGFSQGGAVAVELLRLEPARFERTVLLSSFVRRPDLEDEAAGAVRPLVFWGRGDADPLFDERSLAGTAGWLDRCTTSEAHVYPGLTHAVSEQELADVTAFLSA